MLLTTAISCFLAFWSLLFLADFYLRVYVNWYVDFANRIGLTVSFFQVRFYTNRFHQSLLYQPLAVASPKRFSLISRVVSAWFTLGATASLICFCGVTIYLTKLLWCIFAEWMPNFAYSREQLVPQVLHLNQVDGTSIVSRAQRFSENEVGLTPVIPGLNVPWGHVPLFLFVLAIVGIIHEMGHALAAVDANVPVSGFGIFLFAVYPGAFTEIETEALGRSTSAQKMRIFGAGIWHNLVLAFLGYLVFLGGPYCLSPLYVRNSGVLVRDVDSRSGLSGTGGLRKNHIVYAVNGCGVKNSVDWYDCVNEIKTSKYGYCIPDEEILPSIATKVEPYDSEIHCCSEFSNVSLSHLCFHFKNETVLSKGNISLRGLLPNRGVSLAPNLAESLGLKSRSKRSLKLHGITPDIANDGHARQTKYRNNPINFNFLQESVKKMTAVENKTRSEHYACLAARPVTDHSTCITSTDCKRSLSPKKSTCIFPALFNGTSLIRFYIGNSSKPILFIGSADELVYFVKLSDHVPLYFFAFPWLPYAVELFAKYLITFSLAIALLNAVPCYGLDGQFISTTIVDSLFVNWSHKQRVAIKCLLLYYGVSVLAGNVVIGFIRLFSPYITYYLK